jgi:membrane protease YdiL (CAAX protease family)
MRNKIGFFLLTVIFVEIFVIQFVQLFSVLNPYLLYSYLTTTYIIIAILIWFEINNLQEFHLEQGTLFIFILSSLFRTRLGIKGENYFLIVIALAGLSVFLAFVLHRSKIPRSFLKWALGGVFWGLISLIPIVLVESLELQIWLNRSLLSNSIILIVIRMVIYQFFLGTIMEEILFRGFLWGYLRRLGWVENKIFWGQGILFWLSHFSRIIIAPLTFFFTIPILTFVSSKLTKHSRQVFPSIISHTIINTMIPIILNSVR